MHAQICPFLTCYSPTLIPFSHRHRNPDSNPVLNPDRLWLIPCYIHVGSKAAVVNNCIPEVFIDVATHVYLVRNKMTAA